ncbi:MAG TPA: cohesin domain-containing protein [Thermoanaerobaculia bacterium]|nr:cohesin domain-containing protein [Thermoanaerobaculia bacterium]
MGRARCTVAMAALVLAVSAACGGGGGGGGGGPTQPPPPRVSFTPVTGGATSVSLIQGTGTTETTLFLEVRANQVTDLYGLSFDLTYPTGVVTYRRVVEGPFLAQAASTSLQVAEPSPGRLIIGHSRLGPAGGISGSGLLMTLELAVAGTGTGAMTFQNQQAFDPSGTPRIGYSWLGGTVRVGS